MIDPKTNKYAIAALRERRAELAGELTECERRLRYLRDAIASLDGSLRIMAPDFDPSSIKAKRPYKRVKLFGHGKLNAMIFDVLRPAGRPLTTAEITDGVTKAMGFGPDAAAGLKSRVRSNLLYLSKVRELVVKDGEREGATWRVND